MGGLIASSRQFTKSPDQVLTRVWVAFLCSRSLYPTKTVKKSGGEGGN